MSSECAFFLRKNYIIYKTTKGWGGAGKNPHLPQGRPPPPGGVTLNKNITKNK